jgi:hypothetical protein
MSEQSLQLEFIGGPFDGYTQEFPTTMNELARRVALPINENVFLMLDGKMRGPAAPSRTVALYDLCEKDGTVQYLYLGARLAAELNLGSWTV